MHYLVGTNPMVGILPTPYDGTLRDVVLMSCLFQKRMITVAHFEIDE